MARKTSAADQKIIREALERYKKASDACSEIYKSALDDMEFVSINEKQWADDIKKQRKERPCITENRLKMSLQQVINEQRQNRPQIKVNPVDGDADPDTAEVINGLLRHIQYDSDAEIAFDTAFSCAVKGGIGFYRVLTDYETDEGFEQRVKIERIENPFSVRFPIHQCREMTFADAPYAFVETSMSKDEFQEKYPDVSVEDWESNVFAAGWITDTQVRVCEYFVVDKEYYTLYKLRSGETVTEKPVSDVGFIDPMREVVAEREACRRSVKWYKLTASAIIEREETDFTYIPIIPVLGEEVNISDKKYYISMTRNGKDPQRLLNYWRSAETERIALAPKAPWVVAEGQIDGYSQEWEASNYANLAYLVYKPVSSSGTVLPAPSRTPPTPVDMAILNASKEAIDAIKACTGIFDAGLGAESNEKSGRAILARQRQGGLSNYHFADNFAKSLRHCGRIIIDIIPKVYDTPRIVRILGDDMTQKVVALKQQSQDNGGKIYDLSVGKYDVTVEAGPSYASKRQEDANLLVNMSQSDPVTMQASRDLLAKYAGAPAEVVQRLSNTIPPEIKGSEAKGDPRAELQRVTQELQKAQTLIRNMDRAIQGLSNERDQAQSKLQSKATDHQVQLALQAMRSNAELERAKMEFSHDAGMEAMKHVHGNNRAEIEAERRRAEAQQSAPQTGV